jgi:hypothetical protein
MPKKVSGQKYSNNHTTLVLYAKASAKKRSYAGLMTDR